MVALKVLASIDIASPVNRVHATLVDFHTWPIWSPWLYMEPEASVTYRGSKGELSHGYDWIGKKVGAGGMTLTKSTSNRIECDLQFLKPFKSQADVAFDLDAIEDKSTRLTWHMNSSLPFFMFWMKGTMIGMIRSDYKRGLAMLKDYLESGHIPSSSKIVDIVDVEPVSYVGSRGSAQMSHISESKEASFAALAESISSHSIDVTGAPFSIYNKMDIKRGECDYTVAMPTVAHSAIAPPFVSDTIPACKALKVIHTGPSRHLANAWYVLMGESRFRKLKVSKSIPPFEIYLNDPDTTPEEDLITELNLPLRN